MQIKYIYDSFSTFVCIYDILEKVITHHFSDVLQEWSPYSVYFFVSE